MGYKTREMEVPISIDVCYSNLLIAGNGMPNWTNTIANKDIYTLEWKKGSWSLYHGNAKLNAILRSLSSSKTHVLFRVDVPGQVIDPFGLYDKTLQQLIDPFLASVKQPNPQSSLQPQINVTVHLASEVERQQATLEEIFVPSGVTIKVHRERTIEHTVEINWQTSRKLDINAGLQGIINASIQGELETMQGQTYRTSETRRYEIELSGDKNNKYRLIWTDTWRTGIAEYQDKTTIMLPFRFREQTELEVVSF